VSEERVREIVGELDALGRWVSTAEGEPYIESRVFCRNVELLSEYVLAGTGDV
jgi:hypothetical protein